MKTTIQVTQRHIDRGVGGDPSSCALAIAINEQVPTCEAQVVGGNIGAILRPLCAGQTAQIRTPDSANLFIQAFDIYRKCGHVAPQLKPFRFEIEVPDSLLPAEPVRTHEPAALKNTGNAICPERVELV